MFIVAAEHDVEALGIHSVLATGRVTKLHGECDVDTSVVVDLLGAPSAFLGGLHRAHIGRRKTGQRHQNISFLAR
jgi:hypothetical protein